eukprot:4982524-Prymnesium_polylepis.1
MSENIGPQGHSSHARGAATRTTGYRTVLGEYVCVCVTCLTWGRCPASGSARYRRTAHHGPLAIGHRERVGGRQTALPSHALPAASTPPCVLSPDP